MAVGTSYADVCPQRTSVDVDTVAVSVGLCRQLCRRHSSPYAPSVYFFFQFFLIFLILLEFFYLDTQLIYDFTLNLMSKYLS